ncbi:MAG: sugar phosphate isomerase/epimerase family protein [Candidatus Brocadiia bacterium]
MPVRDDRPLSRRDLLRLGAAAGLAAAGARPLAAEPEKQRPIPVGLQLYSVRGECKKDFAKTIETVGKLGYDGVEFAGYYGWDRKPEALRQLLDDNGLRCCGTHTSLNSLLGDDLGRTIELHKTLGNRFLIVPSLPRKYHEDKAAWLETAKLFDGLAAKAKPHGLRVGYHNHAYEFKPIDGGPCGWDLFFSNTCDDVVMQLDTGNCMGGGGDPLAILRKYPGRAATVHLKERGGQGVVGAGSVPWKDVFTLCRTIGGTEWYIVEFGGSSLGAFECARRCLENIRTIRA